MAENSSRAEKKPPTYEISPKRILIFQAVNLIVGITAAILSFTLKKPEYLICYFYALCVILFGQLCKYVFLEYYDISSEFFHPDLMSKNDFISLRKRYSKLLWKKFDYKEDGKPFPEKYKMLLDNLETRYLSQSDLRLRCWFTKMVGVAIVDKSDVEEPIPSGDVPAVKEEPTKPDPSNSDDNLDSEKNKGDNFDSEFDSINDSESDAISTDDDNDSDSELDFDGDSNISVMNVNVSKMDDIRMTKFDEKISVMQNEIDQLKVQFAEMKDENTKLKNFIETFITLQSCV